MLVELLWKMTIYPTNILLKEMGVKLYYGCSYCSELDTEEHFFITAEELKPCGKKLKATSPGTQVIIIWRKKMPFSAGIIWNLPSIFWYNYYRGKITRNKLVMMIVLRNELVLFKSVVETHIHRIYWKELPLSIHYNNFCFAQRSA